MSAQPSPLINNLRQSITGLMLPGNRTVQPFLWSGWEQGLPTPDGLLSFLGAPRETPVEVIEIDDFFRPLLKAGQSGSDEIISLIKTLKNHLMETKVYVVGRKLADVYIVGRTQSGDLAGLFTTNYNN
jgi:hypothetical protein